MEKRFRYGSLLIFYPILLLPHRSPHLLLNSPNPRCFYTREMKQLELPNVSSSTVTLQKLGQFFFFHFYLTRYHYHDHHHHQLSNDYKWFIILSRNNKRIFSTYIEKINMQFNWQIHGCAQGVIPRRKQAAAGKITVQAILPCFFGQRWFSLISNTVHIEILLAVVKLVYF